MMAACEETGSNRPFVGAHADDADWPVAPAAGDPLLTDDDVMSSGVARPRVLDDVERIAPQLVRAYLSAREDGSVLAPDLGRALLRIKSAMKLSSDARVFLVYEIARLAAVDHRARRLPLTEAVRARLNALCIWRTHDDLLAGSGFKAMVAAAHDFSNPKATKTDLAIAIAGVMSALGERMTEHAVRVAVARERRARGLDE